MKILIFSLIALMFLVQTVSAQELLPGETTFEILTINLTQLCSPDDDFTGTCQNLALYGDLSYLNIKWNAYFSDGIDREIGVECYLNCPNPGENITNNCLAYKISRNYCSYKSLTGYGICTIVNPNYLFKNQINNVTCRFYDPSRPNTEYLPYPNRTFYPTKFDVFTSLNATVTVGESFVLELKIRNLGLIVSNFTSNVSALNKQDLVIIENPITQTGQLKYNQIGKLYPKITFLSAEKINFKVLTKSNIEPVTCSINEDCSYHNPGECVNGRCWKKNVVEVDASMLSLPEFGWNGLLQIIILSSIVILFIGKI